MPHTMKRIYLLVLPVLAILLASCEGKNVSTPVVRASSTIIRTSAAGVQDTISYQDTLCVGDTLRMGIIASGNYNALTSFIAKADTNHVRVSLAWDEEYDQYLTANADPAHGVLKFVPEQVYAIQTTLKYIPRTVGTHTINMVVASDAGESYSPREYNFDIVVK